MTNPPTRARLVGCVSLALAVASGAVLAAVPSTASAQPVERGVISEQIHETVTDFCGLPGLTVTSDVTIEGTYSITLHQPGDPAYYAEHVTIDQVVTNPDNGRSTRVHGRSLSKDVVVHQDGNVLTLIFLVTGGSSLYGPDGKLIAKRSGQMRFRTVVDNNGTPADPDDDVEISFELLKSTGPNDNYCDQAPLLLG